MALSSNRIGRERQILPKIANLRTFENPTEGMSILAICFCRPIERWLGILKRRELEYDDYIYQLFKSSGSVTNSCVFPNNLIGRFGFREVDSM